MIEYQPDTFSDIGNSDLGKSLWTFLNSDNSLNRLKLATKLRHPAVEGVDEELMEKFGEAVRPDRIKQTIGHMVRQILEHHGYTIDAQNVICRTSALFSRGTRYRPRA